MAQPKFIAVTESSSPDVLESRGVLRLLLVAMRPHQWVKNSFILTPLFIRGKLGDAAAVISVLLAFLAFCFMAGAPST
ncbi:MAG: hypothetical protein WKF84_22785 [Pyrinomonadaceae bacterium]